MVGRLAAVACVGALALGSLAVVASADVASAGPSDGTSVFVQRNPPIRLIDTRQPDGPTGAQQLGPGAMLTIPVRGQVGVPAEATAVAVNLTAESGTEWSFFTVWDDGPLPNVSALNWTEEMEVIANSMLVPIGADGSIRAFNAFGSVHLIVDVTGWYVPHATTDGASGSQILSGDGEPGVDVGVPGDFYVDMTTGSLYGPKLGTSWDLLDSLSLIGPVGGQGPQGEKGASGADGAVGDQGPKGDQGDQGPAGVQGLEGPQGEKGASGADGAVGDQGPKGDQGDQGPAGEPGPQGNATEIIGLPHDPALDQGEIGDYWLNTDTAFLWGPKTGLDGWGEPIGLQGPEGPQGAQGMSGDANNAHATILADGTIINAHNVAAVTHIAAGAWCVTIDISVDALGSVPFAAPADLDTAVGLLPLQAGSADMQAAASVRYEPSVLLCPPNSFRVLTTEQTEVKDAGYVTDISFAGTDMDFNFVSFGPEPSKGPPLNG